MDQDDAARERRGRKVLHCVVAATARSVGRLLCQERPVGHGATAIVRQRRYGPVICAEAAKLCHLAQGCSGVFYRIFVAHNLGNVRQLLGCQVDHGIIPIQMLPDGLEVICVRVTVLVFRLIDSPDYIVPAALHEQKSCIGNHARKKRNVVDVARQGIGEYGR